MIWDFYKVEHSDNPALVSDFFDIAPKVPSEKEKKLRI